MPTTPYHSDDANDANCISCITTPQKSPPTQPQKTFPRRTLLPQHVPSLRVPFAGHPPRPPNYSLRSPSTTQLAPSTKAGFRNLVTGFLFCQTVPYLSFLSLWGQGRRRCKDASAHILESYPPWCNNKWIVNMFKSSHQQLLSSFLTSFLFHISESIGWFSDKTRQHSQPIITLPKRPTREHT